MMMSRSSSVCGPACCCVGRLTWTPSCPHVLCIRVVAPHPQRGVRGGCSPKLVGHKYIADSVRCNCWATSTLQSTVLPSRVSFRNSLRRISTPHTRRLWYGSWLTHCCEGPGTVACNALHNAAAVLWEWEVTVQCGCGECPEKAAWACMHAWS